MLRQPAGLLIFSVDSTCRAIKLKMRIENIKCVDGHDYPLVPSFIQPNPFECGVLVDFYMVPVYIRISQEQQIINDPTTVPNINVAIQPLLEFAGAQTACFAKYKTF